jgi:hypothetical protein
MNCSCSNFVDIRGRCLPENLKEWKNCKVKCETTYWLMFNDGYDIYKLIELYNINDKRVKVATKNKYNISNKEWKEILKIYMNDEDNNTSFLTPE